ncbi:ribonuclease H-like domain-containing protein [Tanacetum coccineum]|uniref:Ribonuclease H-like domain-containing protein n=1 Tax=Tanacetum coccineum TaxID=301880 RepID=A0ABQ5DRC6_9ASTR
MPHLLPINFNTTVAQPPSPSSNHYHHNIDTSITVSYRQHATPPSTHLRHHSSVSPPLYLFNFEFGCLEKDKCFVKDSSELNFFSENDEVTSHKIFFDDFQTDSQASSPNDDGREPSGSNIGPESESDDTAKEHSSDNDQGSMQICEDDFSKGNDFENNDVPTNLFDTGESNTLRRSSRRSKLPHKLNDYVLNNKSYEEVVLDKNWAQTINEEIEAIFSEDLVENDFKQCGHDNSLYTKESGGSFVALLVYVDDIVLLGNDINEFNKVKTFLKSKFKIKDLGELKYFLGIESHMDLGLRVLKYLKGALGSGVNYEKSEHMSLKVKKQVTLSKSSAEAEYRSIAAATCEVMWVVNNLKDLKVTNLLTAELYFDNSVTIQIVVNLVMHEKTKHFDVDVHIIREKVASGLIKTAKIDSENQTADIFTKALGFP